jgi:hypothetical protein
MVRRIANTPRRYRFRNRFMARAVEVSNGVVHRSDLVPSLPKLQERVLHDLLRFGAVPGDEPQTSEQRLALGIEEDLEASDASSISEEAASAGS